MQKSTKKLIAGTLAWIGMVITVMSAGMSDGGVGEGWVILTAAVGLGMLTAGVGLYNHVTGGTIEDKWEVE